MLTYPWKCTVLHCNHLGKTWKPLVLMTRHSEGDNQSVGSSAPVVSRCFPGGYNVKLYISRGRLAWWLLAFLHSDLKTLDICIILLCCYTLCFCVCILRVTGVLYVVVLPPLDKHLMLFIHCLCSICVYILNMQCSCQPKISCLWQQTAYLHTNLWFPL